MKRKISFCSPKKSNSSNIFSVFHLFTTHQKSHSISRNELISLLCSATQLSSSINSGIFCEITSLKTKWEQICSESSERSVEPASISFMIMPQFPPPRKMKSSNENYLQCHFPCMITPIFPIAGKCITSSLPCSGTSSPVMPLSAVQTKS